MLKRTISAKTRRRSEGRALMLVGVVLAAALWVGLVPGLSPLVQTLDDKLRDRLSLMMEPTPVREDLVFVGIDERCRRQEGVSQADREASRALRLMKGSGDNLMLDRRVFADLVDRLGEAGARAVIFDVLFIGSSGSEATDREFAEALNRNHERVVLSMMFRPRGDGSYERLSSIRQLPGLDGSRLPHEGYVNLWPDASDGVVRRAVYTTTESELEGASREEGEWIYESLSGLTGRLMGARIPEDAPRLRYAAADGESFSEAYGPHPLHGLFVPERWETEYGGGSYFKDKVVLISTSTLVDGDRHPIPGAVIFGGQFHLQALGCLLEDSYWEQAPQWVDVVALLVMAGLAVMIGFAVRNPLAILLAALALGGGFVVACGLISGMTGVLFAGTPGLVGLVTVTIFAEIGQLFVRRGGAE